MTYDIDRAALKAKEEIALMAANAKLCIRKEFDTIQTDIKYSVPRYRTFKLQVDFNHFYYYSTDNKIRMLPMVSGMSYTIRVLQLLKLFSCTTK